MLEQIYECLPCLSLSLLVAGVVCLPKTESADDKVSINLLVLAFILSLVPSSGDLAVAERMKYHINIKLWWKLNNIQCKIEMFTNTAVASCRHGTRAAFTPALEACVLN